VDVTERPDRWHLKYRDVNANGLVERRTTERAVVPIRQSPNRIIFVSLPVAPHEGIPSKKAVEDQLTYRQHAIDSGTTVDLPKVSYHAIHHRRVFDPGRNAGRAFASRVTRVRVLPPEGIQTGRYSRHATKDTKRP
jgi:hypothetical protein